MPISVLCPNGHKLSCPDERAGKTGRCPKCGSAFEIPLAPEPTDNGQSRRTTAGETPGTIVFLCPNGHKLNGPASLQGRAGQCPHCKERFRIPFIDEPVDEDPDAPAEEELESFEPAEEENDEPYNEFAEFEGSGIDNLGDDFDAADEEFESEAGPLGDDIPVAGLIDEAELSGPRRGHAFKRLFERLWEEKQHGATVRIDLGGETYTPQWYSPKLSQDTHGVFAVRAENKDYTMTVIAWDAIRRVDVLPLAQLPEEMFE
ncbi:MAG: hypothetical protein WD176_07760 [Pirellulales bacterium]